MLAKYFTLSARGSSLDHCIERAECISNSFICVFNFNHFVDTVCGVSGFCAIGLKDHITDYKLFTQGITVAWLNTYVQKQPRYLEYVLDRELIPKTIKLSMYETDVQCNA